MNKEAIEKLESIKVVPATDDAEGVTCCKMRVSDYVKIDQALAILKEQPPVGEFVKNLRDEAETLQLYAAADDTRGAFKFADIYKACTIIDRSEAGERILEERIEKLSDTLDRSEASRKVLLTACVEFRQKFSSYGRISNPKTTDWRHSQEYKELIIDKFEVAITKVYKD